MDKLSAVLEACRVEGAMSGHFSLRGPWALRSDGVPGALFRICSGAPYWIQLGADTPVQIGPRDVILLPHGSGHRIFSAADAEEVPFSRLLAEQGNIRPLETPLVVCLDGGGPLTEIFSGVVQVRGHEHNPVIRMLPRLIHIREQEFGTVAGLGALISTFVAETQAGEPGWRICAARLSDLLFVNILRAFLKRSEGNDSNWLRGLSDPKIAQAIMRMHDEPRAAWTVSSLAKAVGMSRSRFSARFGELVGQSPISYLTAHRISLAVEYLSGEPRRIGEIAALVGYESDKVFARAFRRCTGVSPSKYMRERAQGDVGGERA